MAIGNVFFNPALSGKYQLRNTNNNNFIKQSSAPDYTIKHPVASTPEYIKPHIQNRNAEYLDILA